MQKSIVTDAALVAKCGLYCGACKMYLSGKCPGCTKNEKAAWCKIRICTIEQSFASCAECGQFEDPMACKKFNNVMSKIFAFLFRSNRAACIKQVRENGIEKHAEIMAKSGHQSIKR
ncbi:MAG: DUF3795 domain-containing protein [Fibrobacter sp.]|nr:DUF3795 domain-containing protein [Fibrobacter sp.]